VTTSPVARALVIGGFILIGLGLLWGVLDRFGIQLGKLPGDIAIRRENVRVYFPLMTSLLLSAGLSLLFFLIQKLKK